jgi:hypothetical protein
MIFNENRRVVYWVLIKHDAALQFSRRNYHKVFVEMTPDRPVEIANSQNVTITRPGLYAMMVKTNHILNPADIRSQLQPATNSHLTPQTGFALCNQYLGHTDSKSQQRMTAWAIH